MDTLAKLNLVEKLIREIRIELSTRPDASVESEADEIALLCGLKKLWDEGLRSESSKAKRYFKTKDVCTHAPAWLVRALEVHVGNNNAMLDVNVGKALTMLSGKSFGCEGVAYKLEKYVVSSKAAYRFVEL